MGGTEFDAVFRSLFTVAFRVARRILGDPTQAEDVAAETMSRAYAHWDRIGDAPHLEAWVARVATNLSLNVARRRRPSAPAPGTTAEADRVVDEVALADALRRLPRRQREVLVLRHVLGYSETEVAAELGLGHGTVKTHLRRAYGAMRVHLSDPWPESDRHG